MAQELSDILGCPWGEELMVLTLVEMGRELVARVDELTDHEVDRCLEIVEKVVIEGNETEQAASARGFLEALLTAGARDLT
ncbi:hypothetical protein LX15_000269 [Streptoalloteichus tenebrarius]|uniref:Uncharacterized protein n=1 Tax=Streptoalloteichus tenebrarius (strain ATCC 17920 / DSM 40477 / JCM 4838 / CBS 697.72 / NBRC 16177 / NCIMB 11028 / NRRL B-12390 / A12253. 1 / ISP 5477) TaxID=1933 RepID=A0ABT1HM43_STRSD|nr:hypothetical protein [Streptoalloteichus tenebrarius]MCP2256586.1 hypothetical protein [Streptoalloteichus tenebrarius]BFF04939.1 hypothetical protein GCM10020241_66140 [Streptoalloteichus tenebrarius]